MEDLNKCPMCESPVQEDAKTRYCPTCYTDFEVRGSALVINHVGEVSVGNLRKALQHMMGSYRSILA
jgi:hypothetical protein